MFKPTLSTISFRKLRNQLREKVGLKALLDSSQPDVPECLEIPRFGCLPKPLQKRTVWWSFSILFCVLWGGVHKASNVRKCRSKHIQPYRLENVGLKAFLRSRQPVVPGCMFVWCSFLFSKSIVASIGTTQFGQADLSKVETHTEAPMTQLGRAAAPSSIIDHVCFVSFSVFSFSWCQ